MTRPVEERLLTKVLEAGSWEPVSQAKISKEHFSDSEMREVFAVMENHVLTYGELPSLELLNENIQFEPVDCEDSLAPLIDAVKEGLLYNDIAVFLRQMQAQLRDDPYQALLLAGDALSRIRMRHSDVEDMDASASADTIMERYQAKLQARAEKGLIGLPWRWPYLNEVTGGIRSTDFIILFAQAKRYKSWTAIDLAVYIYMTTGVQPLFFTKEMTKEEIQDKAFATFAGLPWGPFNSGRLDPEQMEILSTKLEEFKRSPPFHIAEIQATGVAAVSEIRAKIEQHRAKLVIVDGVYFLSPAADWKELTQITRAMRQLNLELQVPFIAVTQANGNDEAGYSSSFKQDATYLIRVKCEPEHKQNKEALLEFPYVRDHVIEPLLIHAKPGEGMTEKVRFDEQAGEGEMLPEGAPDNLLNDDPPPPQD